MNVELPNEYIVQQIFQLAGYPKIQRGSGVVTAGCPSCREGSSWNVKRRLTYLPQKHFFYCHNCNRNWSPVNFIMEFSGKSFNQVMIESKEYEFVPADLIYGKQTEVKKQFETLPKNSINLFDPQQVEFYKNKTIVWDALALIKHRKLDIAVNKCPSMYVSSDDYIHKDRLCIPFEDEAGKVVFYQTRTILKTDKSPKYLGKMNSEKTVFGINRVSEDIDYIFIFEGPIDAMFVQNGVAIAGVTMTEYQRDQLKKFPFHKQIWVLDNQHIDETARLRTQELIDAGEWVFLWQKSDTIKDFNDLAIHSDINEIPTKYILQNSFSGLQAKLKFKQIFT